MNGAWDIVRLKPYCRKIGSGATPRGGERVYQEEGVALIRSQNVYNGEFAHEGLAFLGEGEARQLEGVTVEVDDILLNITGDSVARCCQVPGEILPARVNQHVAIIRSDADEFDQRFLKYFLISPFMQSTMLSLAGSGGTRKALTKEMIQDFKVPKPLLSIQQRVSDILSAYDDLIENNRRRMALLENAARLLYQEWFVRLRFPGHERARFVDGTPEGWAPSRLGELIDITHGYAFDGEYFSDTQTSRVLMTPGNFRIGGGIKIDKPKYYGEEGPLDPNYVLTPGELVVTMTDLSIMSDTLGYPAFVPELDDTVFLHNQRVGRVVPLTEWFPRHFLFFAMCDARYRYHVLGSATGTAVKHTAPKRILSYSHRMPLRALVDRFEAIVAPHFEQAAKLLRMNQKLRAARDLLLPRLMSGEIKV